jgi:hypothetical protein
MFLNVLITYVEIHRSGYGTSASIRKDFQKPNPPNTSL